MSLNSVEVRELIKELVFFIDATTLVHSDTPFISSSPSSIVDKNKTIDNLLGEVSSGIMSLMHTSQYIQVFGMVQQVPGSEDIKENVPILHDSVIELFDMLTSVIHMIDKENE